MTEEAAIQSILDHVALPDDVLSVDFSFSDDSTGMPAVWINLHVVDDYHPSPAKVSRLVAAKEAISRPILDAGFSCWPYVRLIADGLRFRHS